ncbi:MAG: carbon storage regulator CsrA [Gammaproteobacteria bacterium]|nr:carbon storage regulator CsrA [Gammaproteobacteria bacterium]
MLVLSRKIGESIIICDNDKKIEIKIFGYKGSHTKIGIAAPKSVSVNREEVYQKINEKILKKTSENLCLKGVPENDDTIEH